MKRKLLVVLVAILTVAVAFPICSNAEEVTLQPRFSHVSLMTIGLDVDNGIAECYGCGCSQYTDTYTYLYVTLQRRPLAGGNWSPVASWTGYSEGYSNAVVDEVAFVTSGYDYRVYVCCQIKDETGYILESIGKYSRIDRY